MLKIAFNTLFSMSAKKLRKFLVLINVITILHGLSIAGFVSGLCYYNFIKPASTLTFFDFALIVVVFCTMFFLFAICLVTPLTHRYLSQTINGKGYKRYNLDYLYWATEKGFYVDYFKLKEHFMIGIEILIYINLMLSSIFWLFCDFMR